MSASAEILQRFGPQRETILSGLLVAAAFPPWDLEFLVWVALVPWLVGITRTRSLGEAAVQGLWLGVAIGLLAAHWVAVAAHEFLQLGWPASVLVLLLFAIIGAQPHLVLWAPLVRWAERKTRHSSSLGLSLLFCLCLALCYAGLEWCVPRPLDAGLGYALHDAASLRQIAELGGAALLTFTVVLVNLLVWRLAALQRAGHAGWRALATHAVAVVLIIAGMAGYGAVRNREIATAISRSEQSLRVGIVQGNVANDVRLAWARGDERAAEQQLSAYMLLTETLREQPSSPDLMVWPEATFPGVFGQPLSTLQRGRANKFDRQVLKLRRPIVFGAYDMTGQGADRTLYNALFAITPDYDRPGSRGRVLRYHKHELLPFAETLPKLLRSEFLRRYLPSLGFFGSGAGASVFEIETPDRRRHRLAPILCSEALATGHVIESVRLGGELLLNVGSDGWFGQRGEPQFHLAISRFRSVETRRTQIRAANTGISAVILPSGEIRERSELGVEATLIADVPVVTTGDTLMVRWGDWFGRAAFAPGIALLIVIHLLASRRPSSGAAG